VLLSRATKMVTSYSEGALKNHQQLSRTSRPAPFALQAIDKDGLLGKPPFILPYKSLSLSEGVSFTWAVSSSAQGKTRRVLAK